MTRPCRLCGVTIELAHLTNGRRVALDLGTHADGTIDIDADGTAHPAGAAALLDREWPLRRKHATTCTGRRRGHDHTERSN